MTELVPYELIAYTEPHFFSLGDKKFVYVHIVVEADDGQLKEMNFQVFTLEKWENLKATKTLYLKENVAQNIMVGDYYS